MTWNDALGRLTCIGVEVGLGAGRRQKGETGPDCCFPLSLEAPAVLAECRKAGSHGSQGRLREGRRSLLKVGCTEVRAK